MTGPPPNKNPGYAPALLLFMFLFSEVRANIQSVKGPIIKFI